jgi:hypothetical protein
MEKRFESHFNLEGDIQIVLDSYDDIFSDFDAREYSVKSISEDFLDECKKATSQKKEVNNLKFFIPKNKRNAGEEIKIKKRLKDHFNRHLIMERRENEKQNLIGFNWFIAGCVLTVLTVILMNTENFGLRILVNIAHPGGWFFFWEGLGKLLLDRKERYENYYFYKKMNSAIITFNDCKSKRL